MIDLTSGEWRYDRVGSKHQQKALRVPLAATQCGQDLAILWQVDVEVGSETQIAQQVITIWAVGKLAEINKAIDRVIKIQQMYTQEHVRDCRKRPIQKSRKLLPVRFTSQHAFTISVPKCAGRLDVTNVDQATIDMASMTTTRLITSSLKLTAPADKFYALTKPLIRAIIANDLTAEFPFDLSTDETQVINHFETASLILGRSGTGKTTCLIFKMVSKYLARRTVIDEPPMKQVIFTPLIFFQGSLSDFDTDTPHKIQLLGEEAERL